MASPEVSEIIQGGIKERRLRYNELIATMAAQIASVKIEHYTASGGNGIFVPNCKFAINFAKELAKLAGVEEPKD